MLFLKRHETLKDAIKFLPKDDVSQMDASKDENIRNSIKIIHDHLHHERNKLEPSLMQIKEDIEKYVKQLENGIQAIGKGFITDGKKDINQARTHLTQVEKDMKKFMKLKHDEE